MVNLSVKSVIVLIAIMMLFSKRSVADASDANDENLRLKKELKV